MKKIKVLLIIFSLLLLVGCSCAMENTPKAKVESYLKSYQNLDDDILAQLDQSSELSEYSDNQKTKYKDVLKKQYQDLKYVIKEEVINGDDATVTAEVTVYDLYKVQQNAALYQTNNPDNFLDTAGVYDKSLFLDYKLEQMKKVTDTVSYTISFTLTKADNKWKINDITNDMLQKIHGIYNYET